MEGGFRNKARLPDVQQAIGLQPGPRDTGFGEDASFPASLQEPWQGFAQGFGIRQEVLDEVPSRPEASIEVSR